MRCKPKSSRGLIRIHPTNSSKINLITDRLAAEMVITDLIGESGRNPEDECNQKYHAALVSLARGRKGQAYSIARDVARTAHNGNVDFNPHNSGVVLERTYGDLTTDQKENLDQQFFNERARLQREDNLAYLTK